jgi:predicted AAA+ superfamily ATPase
MINREVIKELISWKNKSERKPLILRGARQVGKTTVNHDFSSQFDVFLFKKYINTFDF